MFAGGGDRVVLTAPSWSLDCAFGFLEDQLMALGSAGAGSGAGLEDSKAQSQGMPPGETWGHIWG